MMFRILMVLGIFFAGQVFATNLSDWFDVNPEFKAEGWKSIVAVGVAMYCGCMLSSEENQDA